MKHPQNLEGAHFFRPKSIVTLIYVIYVKSFKIKDMIKVISKTGDVHFLNENALLQIEFRKEEGTLIAYPVDPSSSKIVLEGILKITDKVKTGDHKTDKIGYNRPISEVIDHLRASGATPGLITRLGSRLESWEIVTVDDLVSIGRKRFSGYRSIGLSTIIAISNALNELYGIGSW